MDLILYIFFSCIVEICDKQQFIYFLTLVSRTWKERKEAKIREDEKVLGGR